MNIITENTRFNTIRQLGIVLLFLLSATGCGNKGDLYHPDEAAVSQANHNAMTGQHVKTRLPV